MTDLTRRELLKVGAHAAALTALPPVLGRRPVLVDLGDGRPVPAPPITDPDVKELALRAIEASRAAGASYADVRLTHTYARSCSPATAPSEWVVDNERMHVGVRALVDGAWGFAASGIWTRDEMSRLGRSAAQLARASVLGKSRRVELAPVPKVADGHWATPVTIDPFQVEGQEIYDVLMSTQFYAESYKRQHAASMFARHVTSAAGVRFELQDKAFASTEGSYCTQRLYRTQAHVMAHASRSEVLRDTAYFPLIAGAGWELVRDRDLRATIWALLDEVDADLRLPRLPLEVGRYDMVLDARAVALLLSATLGRATELDRALGYEANASGTSYLNDPVGMVGTQPVGAELLTVTANRSEPGGCATVQWDDEGVAPEDFTLVAKGVLTDFHTTRASAAKLAAYDQRRQRPLRSHGCAAAPTAHDEPLTHMPNLVMAPGRETQDFEALLGTIKNGVAVRSWNANARDLQCQMDFQCLNGLLPDGVFYRVKEGKRMARLVGDPALLFRSPDLWKGLVALGGAGSVERHSLLATKGEPSQAIYHTVTAPPVLAKQLTLITVPRRHP